MKLIRLIVLSFEFTTLNHFSTHHISDIRIIVYPLVISFKVIVAILSLVFVWETYLILLKLNHIIFCRVTSYLMFLIKWRIWWSIVFLLST